MPVCDKCIEDEEPLPEFAEGLLRVASLLKNHPRVQQSVKELIRSIESELYGRGSKPSSRLVYSSRGGVLQPVYDERGRIIAQPSRA